MYRKKGKMGIKESGLWSLEVVIDLPFETRRLKEAGKQKQVELHRQEVGEKKPSVLINS